MHTPFFKLFNCSTVQLFGLTKLSHSILTFGRVCFRSGKFKQARLSSRLLADFNLRGPPAHSLLFLRFFLHPCLSCHRANEGTGTYLAPGMIRKWLSLLRFHKSFSIKVWRYGLLLLLRLGKKRNEFLCFALDFS